MSTDQTNGKQLHITDLVTFSSEETFQVKPGLIVRLTCMTVVNSFAIFTTCVEQSKSTLS